jgi:hypothetical protein
MNELSWPFFFSRTKRFFFCKTRKNCILDHVPQNLDGSPNFRSLLLRWERQREQNSIDKNSIGGGGGGVISANFSVRYCENQSWGLHNCCTREATDETGLVKTADDGVGRHEAYSFNLKGEILADCFLQEHKDKLL